MSKEILLTALLLGTAGSVRAEEAKELGVSLEETFMSKLLDKGGNYYGSKSAILSTAEFDLWDTGFGLAVWHRRANSSGFENKERLSFKAYYFNSLYAGQTYQMDYKLNWLYHNFPDQPKKAGNYNEMELAIACPSLFSGGLVPSYALVYEHPAHGHYANRASSGWYHQFGLGYDWTVPQLSDQVLHLSADVAYRDGLGGGPVDHDWSHASFGVCTAFKINSQLSFTPGLYHQISMDDSVNTGDETYSVFSLIHRF